MGTALHCTLVTARYAKRSTSLTEEAVVLYLRMGRMRWLWAHCVQCLRVPT